MHQTDEKEKNMLTTVLTYFAQVGEDDDPNENVAYAFY